MNLAKEIRHRVQDALSVWADRSLTEEERVHRARRLLKRARSAAKLSRRKPFRRLERRLGDAARRLSPLRDHHVLPASLRGAPPPRPRGLRRELERSLNEAHALPSSRRASEGLSRCAKKARRRMERALESGDPEDFHEWRKAVKVLRYQMELFGREEVRALERLGDLLGEDHDLGLVLVRTKSPARRRSIEARRLALRRRASVLGRRLSFRSATSFVHGK